MKIELISIRSFYWIALFFAILTVVFASRLYNSQIGKAFEAVRDSKVLAEASGISARRYKTLAFVIGCAIAGFAGNLFAGYRTCIEPNSFTMTKSMEMLVMNMVGGMGTLGGAIFGAVIFSLIPELIRGFVEYQMVFYGLLIILILRLAPLGCVPMGKHLWNTGLQALRRQRSLATTAQEK